MVRKKGASGAAISSCNLDEALRLLSGRVDIIEKAVSERMALHSRTPPGLPDLDLGVAEHLVAVIEETATIRKMLEETSDKVQRIESLLFMVPDIRALDGAMKQLRRVQECMDGKTLSFDGLGQLASNTKCNTYESPLMVPDEKDEREARGGTLQESAVQCPEEPCHIVMHKVFPTELEHDLVVQKAASASTWLPFPSGTSFVSDGVVKVVKDCMTIDSDEVLSMQLPVGLIGRVGYVESDGDAHVYFPSLAAKVLPWRWIHSRDCCKFYRACEQQEA